MTKEQYELLLQQNFQARQKAAAMGQVLPTGGLDLTTGVRQPAFKFGPIEIGDATDYGKLGQEVIADTTAVNRAVLEAGEQKAEEQRQAATQDLKDLLQQNSTGNIGNALEALRQHRLETRDLDREDLNYYVDASVRQTQKQLAASLPYLDVAARRAGERNLALSQRFLNFKENMPTAIQNRMLSSSTAYAQELAGVANAATAAANMARSGTGRRFG
tara:strand:- start:528 stop:1178 length:651 start_codon:yes stop_codon:yes gene_type:complete